MIITMYAPKQEQQLNDKSASTICFPSPARKSRKQGCAPQEALGRMPGGTELLLMHLLLPLLLLLLLLLLPGKSR